MLIFTSTLSSAEASLCCGEAGEKEKESARGTMGRGKREERPAVSLFPSSPARFLFFRLFYFDGDTQREPLRRRELQVAKKVVYQLDFLKMNSLHKSKMKCFKISILFT